MQGAAFGGLIATIVFLAMPPGGDGTGTDFGRGALLLSLLSLPAFLATALGVRERVVAPGRRAGRRAETTGDVATSWRLLCRSSALRRLLATIFAAGLSVTVVSKSILFLFDGIGERRMGLYVALAPSASLLLSAPAWTMVGARLGRSRTLLIAAAMQAAAAGCALLVSGAEALIALTCLAIVAGCGMSIMFWTMVPGVIAECEGDLAASGCAGRIYALVNMSRKLAQALAPQIIAVTLIRSTVSTVAGVAGCAVATLAVIAAYRPRGASDRRLDVGAVPIERGMAG
jgi:Na+/melibiose symporter-like transporter